MKVGSWSNPSICCTHSMSPASYGSTAAQSLSPAYGTTGNHVIGS